jgi:hypothetical protein
MSGKIGVIDMKKIITLFLVLGIITTAGCSSKSEQDNVDPVKVEKKDTAQMTYVVSGRGWAAADPMNLKKVIENSNNQEALKQLFEIRAIFPLKVGMEVRIIEEHEGIVKIRPVDNDTEVWTFKGILKEKV